MTAFEQTEDGLKIYVLVSPRASRDRIESLQPDADGKTRLRVRVTAPPDKGAANARLQLLLSKALKTPKSEITLVTGSTSRTKTVHIKGDGRALAARLEALIGECREPNTDH